MVTFDDMGKAMAEARSTLNLADRVADRLADMLVGRLRCVNSAYVLKKLKMELRHFNAHTGCWND